MSGVKMTTIKNADFNKICQECMQILHQAGFLNEKSINPYISNSLATMLHYSGVEIVYDAPKMAFNWNAPHLPSQVIIDNITLQCALILTSKGVGSLQYNEPLNLIRSFIVDILIHQYGKNYMPLRAFGQRWGCYALWVDIAEKNNDEHIQETRDYYKENDLEFFEEIPTTLV